MKKYIIISGFIFLFCLTGCKPTEKGYKAAYDAALGKREAVKADIVGDLPDEGLQQVDGAQLKEVDGVKVYVLNQRIRPTEEGTILPGRYNVAVGSYKMITNCRSQCEALKSEGFESFSVKDTEGLYYTIAGSFDNLSNAVSFYQQYKAGKNRVYVGLPDSPIIIYSSK